ncbi:hypothetical protein ABWH96_11525 [Marivirga tractuosa]|uniref:hypothetical protein n=1 Tax=Marivirga tractuosa TaxID=1006 RepID=UPI0035D119F3
MRIFIITFFFLMYFVTSAEAQRIRYKNLFPILQSKDYKTAEPQLLKFLEDNDNEANAYFYLGEIIVSKLDSIEVFPTTEKYDSMANRAISAYKRAIELVDDREVRKNDEYYAAYNRRDLRTGKFGIKKSDIHLDYETKIKTVTKKKETVSSLYELKENSVKAYDQLTKTSREFYQSYPDESSFLLRSNSDNLKALQEVEVAYSEFIETYNQFVDELKSLNHPAYNPELKIVDITNWEGLKPIKSDFSDFTITVQDYAKYLTDLKQKIEIEVNPLKELLYKTDAELTEAISKNKNATDSSSIKKIMISEELKNGLNTFDKSEVILNLLKYKKRKSQSVILVNQSIYPVLKDSTNIYQRANLVQDYKESLASQLELIEFIEENINERIILDFKLFLDKFQPSIESYIKTEKTILEQKLDSVSKRSDFMANQIQFFNHEKDSIFLTPLIAATNDSKKYVIKTIELDSMLLIGGLFDKTPFVASATFDMKINNFKLYRDSTLSISNMMLLNDNLLINFDSELDDTKQHRAEYLSLNLQELWKFEYQSNSTLGDAKVEAGIFFLYDQNGKVLSTLNSQGEKIGD